MSKVQYNIYPWQEMQLLELLIRSRIAPEYLDDLMTMARTAARVSNHPACRAKALVLWGKNGDYADRAEIRSFYHDESREYVRRAIMVAIQEMQRGERDNFYRSLVGDSGTQTTARYIQTRSSPTYHYYNPPQGYELEHEMEELYDSDDIDDLDTEDFLY
jgi:hypothetical protein